MDINITKAIYKSVNFWRMAFFKSAHVKDKKYPEYCIEMANSYREIYRDYRRDLRGIK